MAHCNAEFVVIAKPTIRNFTTLSAYSSRQNLAHETMRKKTLILLCRTIPA